MQKPMSIYHWLIFFSAPNLFILIHKAGSNEPGFIVAEWARQPNFKNGKPTGGHWAGHWKDKSVRDIGRTLSQQKAKVRPGIKLIYGTCSYAFC